MSSIPLKKSMSSQLDLFPSTEIAAAPATTVQVERERARPVDEIQLLGNITVLHPVARRCAKPVDAHLRYVSHGPFKMTSDGLTMDAKGSAGKETEASPAPVSGPFEVIGVSRNTTGGEWGLWLQWLDRDRRIHRKLVPTASLHGDTGALCQSLAREGLFIESQRHRELARYLNGVNVASRVTVVDRTGWHEIADRQVFVLPRETIGSSGGETVVLEGAASAPYGSRGNLNQWRIGVAALVSGHHLPVLAISAALAGPLLHLAGAEGGGLHFFGESSKGKTTILQAAASVWGRGGTPGFVRAWRATANGLEGAAALASDTVLILDEMGVVDARDASAAIYGLANGAGKQRAAQDGSLREPKSWRVIVISSGEVPLESKLSEGKAKPRAGQLIRVLDIPSDRGTGFGVFDHGGDSKDAGVLSRAIKDSAVESYGLAGPEFVRLIIDKEISAGVVKGMVAEFVGRQCPPGADGQCERAAQRLGVIGTAGELATSLGVTPWQAGEAADAAAWAFRQWLSNRGGTEPAEARQAVTQVRLFFEQYGEARFDSLDDDESKSSPNRAGWRKCEGGKQEWLIPPEIWKSEICDGLNPTFVAQTLSKRGVLDRVKDGFQSVRKIGGSNRRVYVINAGIYAGREDAA
jgi:putative DNA primase/helicase